MNAAGSDIRLEDFMPIKAPMLLIDEMLESSETGAKARVHIGPQCQFADAAGNVPIHVGVEYMAQTIAAYASRVQHAAAEPPKPGFLVAVDRYDTRISAFENGKSYCISITMTFEAEGLGVFTCNIIGDGNGEIVAEGQLKAYQPDDIKSFLEGDAV